MLLNVVMCSCWWIFTGVRNGNRADVLLEKLWTEHRLQQPRLNVRPVFRLPVCPRGGQCFTVSWSYAGASCCVTEEELSVQCTAAGLTAFVLMTLGFSFLLLHRWLLLDLDVAGLQQRNSFTHVCGWAVCTMVHCVKFKAIVSGASHSEMQQKIILISEIQFSDTES